MFNFSLRVYIIIDMEMLELEKFCFLKKLHLNVLELFVHNFLHEPWLLLNVSN